MLSAATSRSVPQGYVWPRQGPLHLRSVFGWGHSKAVSPPQWHPTGVFGNRQPGGAQWGFAERCRRLRGSQLRRLEVTDVPPGLYVLYSPSLCCCDEIQDQRYEFIHLCSNTNGGSCIGDVYITCSSVSSRTTCWIMSVSPLVSSCGGINSTHWTHRELHFVIPYGGNWSILRNHVCREVGKHVRRIRSCCAFVCFFYFRGCILVKKKKKTTCEKQKKTWSFLIGLATDELLMVKEFSPS